MAYVEHLEQTNPSEQDSIDAAAIQKLKRQLQTTVVTNVYTEKEFKEQFRIVFKTMADILSRTLGPYGSSTMIDEQKNYCVTKDGFHVLQNLRFADTKQNRIRSTLFSISHQMVTKVGDGSTSAVVAAYKFLEEMLYLCETLNFVRPKELNDRIQSWVGSICNIIAKKATSVTQENLLSVVQNITNIATNENEVYTKLITSIYKELGLNCNINIEESKTYEDTVEYEDGIYTTDAYLVDTIYHNKSNQNHTRRCGILMFDHSLDPEIWPMFEIAFNNFCFKTNRTLIVIAPFYDQYLLDKIRKDAESDVRTYSNRPVVPFRTIFLKSGLHRPIAKEMYKDLSSLFGATIYQPSDTKEWTEWFSKYSEACNKARAEGAMQAPEIPPMMINDIENHIGYCDEAVMGDKVSSFKGFTNKNEALFNLCYHDAETKLKDEEERALAIDSVDNKVFDARSRFTKISCKSATIRVGGSNRLEMSYNIDAVDDAVKACASAIKYGYNQGCNLAIVSAIDDIFSSSEKLDEVDTSILKGLRSAFLNVYRTILCNCMNDEAANDIIKSSVEEKDYTCYDLAHKAFDTEGRIINSCRTDIEILKGAIAMVGVVLTCNQYISSTLNH